jgi:hypothetical protein
MADKKISELPKINAISGSTVILPIVHDGTTQKMDVSTFGVYTSQWSATTGSNTFIGNQTITGNATIGGTLAVAGKITAQEFFTEITSASIIFESGSTIFGNSGDDTHTFTGTLILNGLAIGTAELMAQTASQDSVFLGISSVTGAINTTTSSFDSVFLGISSVTGAINTTTSSFDSVFLGISSVTGAINTTTSSFDSVFLGISSVTGAINTQSSSQDLVNLGISTYTGSQNVINSSVDAHILKQSIQTGSQDLVNLAISTYTGSQNVINSSVDSHILGISIYTASANTTNTSIDAHILAQSIQTASQDLVNLGISTYTGSQNIINSSVDSHILKQASQTGSQDLVNLGISSVTGSLIGITNGLMAFTSALDNTYATDAQLYQLYQATASIQAFTSSQDSRNFTISQITSSIDAHILKQAIQTGSQDLVNLGISTFTGSQNVINNSVNSHILVQSIQTGSQDLVNLGISSVTGSLIGITNGLMAFTAALDSTYATDAQLYQLYQATASIQFATASLNTQTGSQDIVNFNISVVTSSIDSHILKQSTQTGSQDLVNLGISTFTGSLRSEVNLIEAYTASLKGAAIVSSSQQITNYYKFAETASANTFYGTQTFVNAETTFNYNPQTSLLAGYNYLNFGGGSIMYRNTTDIYIGSNAKYGSAGTVVANYTSANGMGLLTMDGGNLRWQANDTSVTAGTAYGVPITFAINGDGKVLVNSNVGNYKFQVNSGISTSQATVMSLQQATNGAIKDAAGFGLAINNGGEATNAADLLISTATGGSLTTKVTVASGGDLTINNGNLVIGTAGKGIDFSATSNGSGTTTSELLNDYEEGTWTPTFAGTGGNSGQVYATQDGTYTKVGRLVTFSAVLELSTLGTITGFVRIDGLPFAPAGTPVLRPATTVAYNTTITTIPASVVYGSNSFMYLYKISQTNPTAATQLSQGDLTATTVWSVNGFYYTA